MTSPQRIWLPGRPTTTRFRKSVEREPKNWTLHLADWPFNQESMMKNSLSDSLCPIFFPRSREAFKGSDDFAEAQ
jgi:hypothetical protein